MGWKLVGLALAAVLVVTSAQGSSSAGGSSGSGGSGSDGRGDAPPRVSPSPTPAVAPSVTSGPFASVAAELLHTAVGMMEASRARGRPSAWLPGRDPSRVVDLVVPGLGAIRGLRGHLPLGVNNSSPVDRWLGIPYALPPTGGRRWEPPVPVTGWDEAAFHAAGVPAPLKAQTATEPLDATWFGDSCLSAVPGGSLIKPDVNESESCLFLNIWSPAGHAEAVRDKGAPPLPVIIMLHGGGFIVGSGHNPSVAPPPDLLVHQGRVVFVTLNYRLGAFAALVAAGLHGSGGMFGILDQLEAMRWVHRHIGAFGGDASDVTLLGESAGAISICFHLTLPAAKGLFHKAILESPMCSFPFENAATAYTMKERLAAKLGCSVSLSDPRVLAAVHNTSSAAYRVKPQRRPALNTIESKADAAKRASRAGRAGAPSRPVLEHEAVSSEAGVAATGEVLSGWIRQGIGHATHNASAGEEGWASAAWHSVRDAGSLLWLAGSRVGAPFVDAAKLLSYRWSRLGHGGGGHGGHGHGHGGGGAGQDKQHAQVEALLQEESERMQSTQVEHGEGEEEWSELFPQPSAAAAGAAHHGAGAAAGAAGAAAGKRNRRSSFVDAILQRAAAYHFREELAAEAAEIDRATAGAAAAGAGAGAAGSQRQRVQQVYTYAPAAWSRAHRARDALELECMRALPAAQVQTALPVRRGFFFYSGENHFPVVNGVTMPDHPVRLIEKGLFHNVPLLYGHNADESSIFLLFAYPLVMSAGLVRDFLSLTLGAHHATKVWAHYVEGGHAGIDPAAPLRAKVVHATNDMWKCASLSFASLFAEHGGDVRVYVYDHAPSYLSRLFKHLGAFHGAELDSVFGFYDGNIPTAEERHLSAQVQRLWAEFATGHKKFLLQIPGGLSYPGVADANGAFGGTPLEWLLTDEATDYAGHAAAVAAGGSGGSAAAAGTVQAAAEQLHLHTHWPQYNGTVGACLHLKEYPLQVTTDCKPDAECLLWAAAMEETDGLLRVPPQVAEPFLSVAGNVWGPAILRLASTHAIPLLGGILTMMAVGCGVGVRAGVRRWRRGIAAAAAAAAAAASQAPSEGEGAEQAQGRSRRHVPYPLQGVMLLTPETPHVRLGSRLLDWVADTLTGSITLSARLLRAAAAWPVSTALSMLAACLRAAKVYSYPYAQTAYDGDSVAGQETQRVMAAAASADTAGGSRTATATAQAQQAAAADTAARRRRTAALPSTAADLMRPAAAASAAM